MVILNRLTYAGCGLIKFLSVTLHAMYATIITANMVATLIFDMGVSQMFLNAGL